ncbi:hypothetical protein LTR94_029736, partial [Friedmanniomyces endolithicus]
MNVPPSAKPPLAFVAPDAATAERIARHRDLILTLGRVSEVAVAEAAPAGAVTFVSGGATVALSLAGIIDLAAERARLEKEIAAFDSDIGHVNKKLGNANFVARAAAEVVDEQRAKLAEAEESKAKLQAALARLDAMLLVARGLAESRAKAKAAIEAGASDVESDLVKPDIYEDAPGHVIWTAFEDLNEVADAMSKVLGDPKSTAIVWKPQSEVPVTGDA